jgi:hypothetical protein
MRNPWLIAAARSRGRPKRRFLLLRERFASAPLLCSTPLSAGGIPREHLLEFLIEPELLEQGALLAPDLVRDVGGALSCPRA